ncbi:MAG TPA: FHA domain-containing protein [Armatimonadota bacterium]|nr:FHA domain-containing protein [Armatimonadota bacterium]
MSLAARPTALSLAGPLLAAFLALTPAALYAAGPVKAPSPALGKSPAAASSAASAAPTTAAAKGAAPAAKGPPASKISPTSKVSPAAAPAGPAAGSSALKVSLPAGKYLVWVRQGANTSEPEVATNGSAALVLPAPGAAEIWIDNTATNELAIIKAKSPVTTVAAADFTDRLLPRLVTHVLDRSKKPLGTGKVEYLGADGRTDTETLTPGSEGDAVFSNVAAPGTITVTTPGGLTNSIGIPLDFGGAGTAAITINTAAASALPALAAPIGRTPAKRPRHVTAPSQKSGSGGSVILDVIAALLVLAAIFYIVLMLYKNPRFHEIADEQLKRIGIHMTPPEDPEAAAAAPGARAGRVSAAATDPSICPFCGTRKDSTTGSCACTLVPAGVGSGAPAPVSTSLAAGPRLVTLDGPARGQIFHLNGDTTIGRDTTNTIPLPADTAVSRHHARFTSSEGLVEVVDEGSSNGTFVNGSRVNRQSLQPSDEIQIGHSRFRYEVS